ncbi:pleckstrin homology domain-containing family G member 5 isoform X2 [Planococcus citri]|uniref:pleckstrin homology domain-containing family G member 5 isoform X2 n=1 Tax=Planococcus citri TaxID=170843 RepID=UPI0031F7C222
MRIFLVVSPPVGRMQGRSRSLTHMDALESEAVFQDPIEPERLPAAESPRLIISPPLHIRRQKLARSQVSSSEYFSVTFEVGNANDPDEFVVAAKGTSLADALTPVCSRRGINLSSVNVYLDAYKTPLPVLTTDTSWLGGKHILIKGKDGTSKTSTSFKSTNACPLRRKSGSYHSRSSRFFSVSSDESCNVEGSEKSTSSHKPSKQRWSNLFGNNKFQDSKMEQLIDHLNSYSKHGIPQLHSVDEDLEEALYNLEDDWRDIVSDSTSLAERQQQQQTAIWELVETEVTYIHTLRVLTDLFLACLCNLQSNNLLTEIDKDRLFSNILEIYSANRYFWCQHLLPMLASSRETGKPLNPALLAEGFFKFDELFRPYTKYCAEQSKCQQYCRERHNENELFTAYLVWCETQKDCNRLRLMDILVKPMQRITKYSLLLKAIQKHTDSEEHKNKLDQMINQVDVFVNSVNTTLRYKQEFERLWVVISKIETYDVVDSKDEDLDRILKSYNDFDLTCPMPGCCNSQRRFLLLEGDLKLKECNGAKADVHCFLFTDMLLVCKAASKKSDSRFKVLKQPFIIDRLVIHELPRDPPFLAVIYLTEYKVPATAFLLTCSDNKLLKTWTSSIKKAQDMYLTAKQATTATMTNPSLLALSQQPSSVYDEECWVEADTEHECESHSLASMNLYTLKSPRGSSKGSSLNHSHSGSVELNEAGSSVSSISQSRGISVENELSCLRGSSQSSDEGMSSVSFPEKNTQPLTHRRKCASPNTLSIQVPVFSNLGQSLPNLNQMNTTTTNPPSNMLLAPPKGVPPRGTSYPPPSPPLRRSPALTFNRNPPLLKTRHISGSQASSVAISCDADYCTNTASSQENQNQQRPTLMKRLTRSDKRYHTAGVVDDIKKQDVNKDNRIYKRLSWNCGKRSKQQAPTLKNSTSSASSFGSGERVETVSRNSSSSSCDFGTGGGPSESRSINESIPESSSCTDSSVSSQEIPILTTTTVTPTINPQEQLAAQRRPVDPGGQQLQKNLTKG